MSLHRAVQRLVEGRDLAPEQMQMAVQEILEGKASPALMGAFLAALRVKGERPSEIAAAVRVLREKKTPLEHQCSAAVDTCGTGGDGKGTFNLSTAAALVAAAAGVVVAKHGNRSVSSRCGSADLMEGLGYDLEQTPETLARLLEHTGFAFLFAPRFHPAMRHVGPTRRELGVRTLFNLLGPLANPADVQRQVLGVFREDYCRILAEVLRDLGTEHSVVLCAEGSVDEAILDGPTQLFWVRGNEIREEVLNPGSVGVQNLPFEHLSGGGPGENRATLLRVLENQPGAELEATVLNAALALVVGDRAETISQGVEMAREALASGSAASLLERVLQFSADSIS